MIAVSSRPVKRHWNTVSFASTLYLIPVLDLLLEEIPQHWKAEVRLGLQEALVNAAKHGNALDPGKTVLVRFSVVANQHWWVISDQGSGFQRPHATEPELERALPCEQQECGRGMYLLHQIFDQVQWNNQGTELRLCKYVRRPHRLPLLT
ncbi:ATP-binding protein [Stenomitos frigidus]|uniref:ATP-binding protein n=1 Tax=Stenomitos frigidus ULC18 TaxID=2107698 RepID=A0A2T1DUU8_9CYAN|nr:anti-sigma regulatory factor [Stenomitos frigidus]PSB24260.1 ATP-binding protein [Stenomitos frigidus ULC18]